jgi:hypothetical protein
MPFCLFHSPEVLDRVVEDNVEQWVVSLKDAAALPAAGKLEADALFQVLGQVQNGLLLALLGLK